MLDVTYSINEAIIMGIEINVAANGRMVLPADIRKRMGLENGGKLVLNESDLGLELMTARQRAAKAQELYKKFSEGKRMTTVDELIAQKRVDAAIEDAKLDRL
jgi:AbrB family looped-hinge helix DNA binding protein